MFTLLEYLLRRALRSGAALQLTILVVVFGGWWVIRPQGFGGSLTHAAGSAAGASVAVGWATEALGLARTGIHHAASSVGATLNPAASSAQPHLGLPLCGPDRLHDLRLMQPVPERVTITARPNCYSDAYTVPQSWPGYTIDTIPTAGGMTVWLQGYREIQIADGQNVAWDTAAHRTFRVASARAVVVYRAE